MFMDFLFIYSFFHENYMFTICKILYVFIFLYYYIFVFCKKDNIFFFICVSIIFIFHIY